MSRLRLPYAAAAVIAGLVPLSGEVVTDITGFRLVIGDGVTAGGVPMARKDEVDALSAEVAYLVAVVPVAGTTKVVKTVADLADLPDPANNDRAEVVTDPLGDVENGNGVWRYDGDAAAWEWLAPRLDARVRVGSWTAVGLDSLAAAVPGESSVALGTEALADATGFGNVGAGDQALKAVGAGQLNVGIGHAVARAAVGIQYSVHIGGGASILREGGDHNVFVGGAADALHAGSGSRSVGIGWQVLSYSTASDQVAVGASALLNASTGGKNTALGGEAGTGLTTGERNLIAGYQANVEPTVSGAVVLGSGLVATVDDEVMIGRATGRRFTTMGAVALRRRTGDTFDDWYLAGAGNDAASGAGNFAAAPEALRDVDGGTFLVAIGQSAARLLTDAENGVFIGAGASVGRVGGDRMVMIGANADSSHSGSGADSVGVGYGVLIYSTASDQVAVGSGALNNATTGGKNVGVGKLALSAVTTGERNVAVGFEATVDPTVSGAVVLGSGLVATVNDEVVIGRATGRRFTTMGEVMMRRQTAVADADTFFLAGAGNDTSTAPSCLGIGKGALAALTTGGHNIAIGFRAAHAATAPGSSIFIGSYAGLNVLTAADSILIGFNAGKTMTTGIGTTVMGHFALEFALDGGNNTVFGDSCFRHTTTGQQNVGMGYTCADSNLTGSYNVYLGQGAVFARTQGDYNVFIGYRAGADGVLAGNRNVGIGTSALLDHTGGDMVAVGQEAGRGVTTAASGVFVGYRAGYSVDGQKIDAIGAIAIGANAVTDKDYQAVLGSGAITETLLRGKVIVNRLGVIAGSNGQLDVMKAKATASVSNPSDGSIVVTDTTSAAQNVGGSIVFRGAYTGQTVTEAAAIQALKSNGTAGNFGFDMAFHTRVNGGNNTEKMRIKTDGKVGIGESAPDYLLDVNGSFGFTPGASVSPVDDGDVVFEFTNATTLTIKGRDGGTTRSVALTLA
jgi:hypothetical protein